MAETKLEMPTRIPVSRRMSTFWEVESIALCCALVFFSGLVAVIALQHHESYWLLSPFLTCATLLVWQLRRRHIWYQRKPWDRVTFLEIHNGKIALIPGRAARGFGYTTAQVPFPPGSGLEYRVETGDMLFTGDHGQTLRWSLWVVGPLGARWQLREFAGDFRIRIAAANLRKAGIPFRIVKVYDGQEGDHTETDVTAGRIQVSTKARNKSLVTVLFGTSGLWLAAIAGALVQNGGRVIAIGVVGYAATSAIVVTTRMRQRLPKRTGLVQVLTMLPSYAGGYGVMAILVRHMFHR